VPGLGPKKVKALHDTLSIESLGDLEQACRENHLLKLPGFGAKTQENILSGLERLKKHSGRFLYPVARAAADEFLAWLKKSRATQRLEVAGSLRRRMETVKDIDILAVAKNPAKVMEAFVKFPGVTQITGQGDTKSSIVLASGMAADLRVVGADQWAAALVHFTGSKDHNTALRTLAKTQDRKLSEWGLFEGEAALPLVDEEAVYRALGLHFIPPELREGLDEIDRAAAGPFPRQLEPTDVRGVLHAHTTFSDGALPLRKLAETVRRLGYDYLGVCDHSQSAAYAGGLKPDDVRRQHDEIDALNEEMAPFRIFKGIESDILVDGKLDYDERTLRTFDFVIASVHSRFNLSEEQMTRRLIAAIENPHTTIIGHLTGRLLLSRDPYPLNIPAVLEAAAKHGAAIELNAHPVRFDLDWRWHRRARELGVRLPICPDAHDADDLAAIPLGVGIARKGGLTVDDVPNCWDAKRIAAFFARRKK
jgi:DNA polymerase (family 10)